MWEVRLSTMTMILAECDKTLDALSLEDRHVQNRLSMAAVIQMRSCGCNSATQRFFLANRGILHWGTRMELHRFESHDTGVSANALGEVWIDQMLASCRSNNAPTYMNACSYENNECRSRTVMIGLMIGCSSIVLSLISSGWRCHGRDYAFWRGFTGFEWYDVGQAHIITNSTFRNCTDAWDACIAGNDGNCDGSAFSFLTHSDQWVPGVMQAATNGIQYVNANPNKLWSFSRTDRVSVSGRLANWLDTDGSASSSTVLPSNRQPMLMGSTWAKHWWKLDEECTENSSM